MPASPSPTDTRHLGANARRQNDYATLREAASIAVEAVNKHAEGEFERFLWYQHETRWYRQAYRRAKAGLAKASAAIRARLRKPKAV